MALTELFNVWVADDEIAGTVQINLTETYGESGRNLVFKCFDKARDAANLAATGPRDILPDIAVIDLNFNEHLEGDFLSFDHIDDAALRDIVTLSKNQLGFWVAAEIIAAVHKAGKINQVTKLYTAKQDIKEQLGWAVAPSRPTGKAYLSVDLKDQVTPAEIVHDINEMLWEASRLRVKSRAIDPRVLMTCFALRDFASSMVARFERNAFLESKKVLLDQCKRLAEALEAATTIPAKPFPSTELRFAKTPADVEFALGDDFAGEADYVHGGLRELYIGLKKSLQDVRWLEKTNAITEEDRQKFLSLFNEDLRYEIAVVFPSVSRWLSADCINLQKLLLDDLKKALQVATEGDYSWSLCRALKTININGEFNPETKIAEACHFDWEFEGAGQGTALFPEQSLAEELQQLALPERTKNHLKLRESAAPSSLGLLQSFAWSFSRRQRQLWQEPWVKLMDLQGDEVVVTIDSSIATRQYLTDWRLFFFGENSFIAKLRSELSLPSLYIDVSPRSDVEISLTFKAILSEAMRGYPTGGLRSVLDLLVGWGTSRWEATVLGRNGPERVTCSNWPSGSPTEVTGVSREKDFVITWLVTDYLQRRCLT